MRTLKEKSLLILGYILFCVGALGLVDDLVRQNQFSRPFDMGIILGHGAISLIGLVTIAVAGVLKQLQERLDKIEKKSGISDRDRH
jgi:hypothetical protein